MTVRTRQGLLALGAGLAGAAAVAAVLGAQRGAQRVRMREELFEVSARLRDAERRLSDLRADIRRDQGDDLLAQMVGSTAEDPGVRSILREIARLRARRNALRALTYRSPKGARR